MDNKDHHDDNNPSVMLQHLSNDIQSHHHPQHDMGNHINQYHIQSLHGYPHNLGGPGGNHHNNSHQMNNAGTISTSALMHHQQQNHYLHSQGPTGMHMHNQNNNNMGQNPSLQGMPHPHQQHQQHVHMQQQSHMMHNQQQLQQHHQQNHMHLGQAQQQHYEEFDSAGVSATHHLSQAGLHMAGMQHQAMNMVDPRAYAYMQAAVSGSEHLLHPSMMPVQVGDDRKSKMKRRDLDDLDEQEEIYAGPRYELDGIEFKEYSRLTVVKQKRLRDDKIKPIEEVTFDEIKSYNRNQLRGYCTVYGIKRKRKGEMETDLARYSALFHQGDSKYDVSKFEPTEYEGFPVPKRKQPRHGGSKPHISNSITGPHGDMKDKHDMSHQNRVIHDDDHDEGKDISDHSVDNSNYMENQEHLDNDENQEPFN